LVFQLIIHLVLERRLVYKLNFIELNRGLSLGNNRQSRPPVGPRPRDDEAGSAAENTHHEA
jgi:hypothetical protein